MKSHKYLILLPIGESPNRQLFTSRVVIAGAILFKFGKLIIGLPLNCSVSKLLYVAFGNEETPMPSFIKNFLIFLVQLIDQF